MKSLNILALDPGGTTGYALLVNGKIELGQFPEASRLDELIQPGMTVVYEHPFMTPTTNPVVFEIVGAIKERTFKKQANLVSQQPGILRFMEKRYPAQRLRLAKGIHAREAYYHLMFYLIKRQQLPCHLCWGICVK